jgi:hypothetical protein
VVRPGQAPQADTTAPLTGAVRSLTRKAMMSAAAYHHRYALARAAQRSHYDLPAFDL